MYMLMFIDITIHYVEFTTWVVSGQCTSIMTLTDKMYMEQGVTLLWLMALEPLAKTFLVQSEKMYLFVLTWLRSSSEQQPLSKLWGYKVWGNLGVIYDWLLMHCKRFQQSIRLRLAHQSICKIFFNKWEKNEKNSAISLKEYYHHDYS